MKKKIENYIKSNSFVNKMFTFIGSLVFKILGIFVSKEKNSMLFVSYMGKGFNDSPKLIYDEIIKDDHFNKYKIYVAVIPGYEVQLDERVQIVKMDSLAYFKTALRSEYWITNVNIERGLHFKKKYTTYINTWHGIPFKKVGNDVKGRNDFDFSSVDYFPCSGLYEESIYKRAFKLNKDNLYMSGMPRNDILYKPTDENARVREFYRVGDKKIILYAPTWRDEGLVNKELDYEKWETELSDEYVLMIRSHGLSEEFSLSKSSKIIDVSKYEETSELIVAADVLITDYSSIMFDYSITEKPICIYTYDYAEYAETRGVYFDLEETTLPLFKDEDVLIESLNGMKDSLKELNSKNFKEKFFDVEEGLGTKTIVEFLKTKRKDD